MGSGPIVGFRLAWGSELYNCHNGIRGTCAPKLSRRSCFLAVYQRLMALAGRRIPGTPISYWDEEDLVQEAALKILSHIHETMTNGDDGGYGRGAMATCFFPVKPEGPQDERETEASVSEAGFRNPHGDRFRSDYGDYLHPHEEPSREDGGSDEINAHGFGYHAMGDADAEELLLDESPSGDIDERSFVKSQSHDAGEGGCSRCRHSLRHFYPLFRCVMRQLRIDLWRKETGSGRYRVLSWEGIAGPEVQRVAKHDGLVKKGHDPSLSWWSNTDLPDGVDGCSDEASWEEMLRGLDREDKQLLYLRVWMDLGWREVAEIMGLSEAAARTRFMRIKRRIFRSWSDAER